MAEKEQSIRTIVMSPGTDLEVIRERRESGTIRVCTLRTREKSNLSRVIDEALEHKEAGVPIEIVRKMPYVKESDPRYNPKTGDFEIKIIGASNQELLERISYETRCVPSDAASFLRV